jgi:hypothetical protein
MLPYQDSTNAYLYSIQEDFNISDINLSCLDVEINDTVLISKYIAAFAEENEPNILFLFDQKLTLEEESTLDSIVSNHTGLCPTSEEAELDASNANDGHILLYDSTSNIWVNKHISEGLASICCNNGDILVYNTINNRWEATKLLPSLIGEVSDETVTTTTSTDWQRKLRLQAYALQQGQYKVEWYYEWNHSNSSNEFEARIKINNIIIGEHRERPTGVGNFNDYSFPQSGFSINTLNAGDYNIDIDYATSARNKTAYIRRARLILWRVN